jgi:uncharacterized metal-binding protein YceD (DUF177 family)
VKWTLAQLEAMTLPISVEKELSYNKEILNLNDLLDDFKLNLNLSLSKISNTAYLLHGNVSTSLQLEDSITLEEITYDMNVDIDEIFDVDYTLSEDSNIIENGILDIEPILLELIRLNIPMVITNDKNKKFEDVKLGNEDINPSFEGLLDFFK